MRADAASHLACASCSVSCTTPNPWVQEQVLSTGSSRLFSEGEGILEAGVIDFPIDKRENAAYRRR